MSFIVRGLHRSKPESGRRPESGVQDMEVSDNWTLLDKEDPLSASLSVGWCQVKKNSPNASHQDTVDYWKHRALQAELQLKEKDEKIESLQKENLLMQTRRESATEDPLNPFNASTCSECVENEFNLDLYREVANTIRAICNRSELLAEELESQTQQRSSGTSPMQRQSRRFSKGELNQVDLRVLKSVSAEALAAVIRVNAMSKRTLLSRSASAS